MAGWIKINRKIIEHWLWQDAERLKWWLDLLFMASWEERKTTHDAHLITLQRGQMVASIGYLKDRWGKNHQTILKFLKTLETEGMITRKVLYRQTAIITICNYESYQTSDNDGVYSIVATNKEYNNNISSSLRSEDLSDKKSDSQKSDMDLSKFVVFWNSEIEKQKSTIPKIRSIQGKRKNHILARCREHGKEAIAEMVRKMAQSDFLNGNNDRGWIANFDWVFLPTNFQKVLDGNYDNHSNKKQDDGIYQQDGKVQRKRFETNATSPEDYEGTF
nr:DNA replication protein DnaD [Prevotella sp.]